MSRFYILIVFMLVLSGVVAQEEQGQEPESITADTEPANEEKDNETGTDKTISTTATPDSFEPSEDISEDLSVSFPVDI